jgi:hypothetical protein
MDWRSEESQDHLLLFTQLGNCRSVLYSSICMTLPPRSFGFRHACGSGRQLFHHLCFYRLSARGRYRSFFKCCLTSHYPRRFCFCLRLKTPMYQRSVAFVVTIDRPSMHSRRTVCASSARTVASAVCCTCSESRRWVPRRSARSRCVDSHASSATLVASASLRASSAPSATHSLCQYSEQLCGQWRATTVLTVSQLGLHPLHAQRIVR